LNWIMYLAVSIMMHSHSYRVMWQAHQKRTPLHGQTWHQTVPQRLAPWRPPRRARGGGDEGTGSRSTCTSCVMQCTLWHRRCMTCRPACVGLVPRGYAKTCSILTAIFC
jgi:hypothetical protein